MQAAINNIHIEAIAAALPTETVDLEDLAMVFGDSEVERIIQNNGIGWSPGRA